MKVFTTILNMIEFPKALDISGLQIIYPTYNDYRVAVELSKNLLEIGEPIPAIDILIAAIAINNKMTLKTKKFRIPHEGRVETQDRITLRV